MMQPQHHRKTNGLSEHHHSVPATLLRVLHLEDDPRDAEIIGEKLLAEWTDCHLRLANNPQDFEAALAEENFDVILSDYNVPAFSGLKALALVREKCPATPFVFVSGNMGEEVAVESLKMGATDFVLKNGLGRLVPSMLRALKEVQERKERSVLESQLREREKLFSQITGNVGDLIAVLDLEGKRVYNSPSFKAVLGDPDCLRGTDSFQEIHPEDRERIRKIFQETVRTGISRRTEYRFLLKDNSVRFMESQAGVIRNDMGKITNVLVVSRDVTERKEAEEALRKANVTLKAIFDAAPVAILGLDLDGKVTSWNAGAERLFGWTCEETTGRICPTVPAEGVEDFKRMIHRIVSEGPQTGMTYYQQKKSGERITVSLNSAPFRNAAGQVVGVMVILEDITERKRAEDQICEQAALLNKTQDAIYVHDLEQRITYWNKGAERLYGWTAEETLGKRADELFSRNDSSRKEEARRLILEKGEWMGELTQISKAGKNLFVESRRTLLRDEDGNPKSILIDNTNITARKQAERQMLHTQRLESIGTLAGGVAHDLNNSIAPIMMGLEMLRTQNPKATELINMMESSARRGAEMVRQLLTFAKGAEGARLLIQSRHLLQEMEKIIQGTFPKNIQLRTTYAKLDTILGDATQLHQVLLNLCVNARDAMPNGGTLTLEAENVEIDALYVSTVPEAKPGRYVLWHVTDTGTGIPTEILDRIFEPFFSTKGPDKGTGLGLSTVVGIIKSHGGFVRVYSQPGQGSTFAVYLPVDDSSTGQTTILTKAETTFGGNGETILVVDDDASMRQVARSVLTALNFKVLTAAEGTEALLQVADNRADLRAVITDLHMPHMDGLTFVRVLKRMVPEAGIIVASGRLEEREAKEFKTLEVSALLDKPFTQARLIEALKCVFKK